MQQPFDPAEFYQLALRLAQPGAGEAALRTAVGRAYYSCFLQARERWAANIQCNAHQAVVSALRRHDRLAADLLDRLRRARITADYVLVPAAAQGNWRSNWLRAQALANQVLRRLPEIGS